MSKLQFDFDTRAAYINAKVSTLVPAQIRGLRLKSETPRQPDLGRASKMHQSRISMLETAGANPTIGTLSQLAAGLKVGLKIEFVSFSEMLAWENGFSQDEFNLVKIDEDQAFLNPVSMRPPLKSQPELLNTSWITTDFVRRLTEGHLQNAAGTFWNEVDVTEKSREQISLVFNNVPAPVRLTPQPEYGDMNPWVIDKIRQSQFTENQDS
jgi:hypothetical protein